MLTVALLGKKIGNTVNHSFFESDSVIHSQKTSESFTSLFVTEQRERIAYDRSLLRREILSKGVKEQIPNPADFVDTLKRQCHEIFWHYFFSLIQPIWVPDKH